MLVLKTGIVKKNHEQSEHKGLVWVGDVANTASKLCDFANKNYSFPIFKITYERLKMENKFKSPFIYPNKSNSYLFELLNKDRKSEYTTELVTVDLNYIDFAKDVVVESNSWKYLGNVVKSFNIENRSGISSPILISGKVYHEFKKADPTSSYCVRLTSKNYPNKPFTGSGIYGGTLIVPEIFKIKL